jgi:hypothetical protein
MEYHNIFNFKQWAQFSFEKEALQAINFRKGTYNNKVTLVNKTQKIARPYIEEVMNFEGENETQE